LKELTEALAKAQAEIQNPVFDMVNPHFKSKFASLAAVRNAVIPVMSKYGIFVTQELTTTERGISCSTIFMKGGEELRFQPLVMPASKNDAQGFGSAATYARRYSLMAACGVVGDTDDDGNAASEKSKKITPAGGVLESLDRDVQFALRDIASETQEAFDKAGVAESYNIFKDQDFGADEKVAFWSLLSSSCRSALKKYINEQKEAA
jgi:hypothetical protein